MKFVIKENDESTNVNQNNDNWSLVETINSTKTLTWGVIVGVILTIIISFVIQSFTLCKGLDFHVFNRLYLIVLLIPLHEFIHVLIFPNIKNTQVGFVWRKLSFFVTTNDIFSKKRLLLVSIAPLFILTIIPFIFLFFVNSEIIAYIALYNSLGSGVDIISFIIFFGQSDKNLFRFNGPKLYCKQSI